MAAIVRVVVENEGDVEVEFRSELPTMSGTPRAVVAEWWAQRLEETAKELRKMWPKQPTDQTQQTYPEYLKQGATPS